jgi:hypothetical protein
MADPKPREIYLDHGGVTIQCLRLMTDDKLADVLSDFVDKGRGRSKGKLPPRGAGSAERYARSQQNVETKAVTAGLQEEIAGGGTSE